MQKNIRYAHFAEICEKCGNVRNIAAIRVKITCLLSACMQVASSMRGYLQSGAGAVSDWRRCVWRASVVVGVLVVAVVAVWPADASYERTCSLDQLRGRRAGVCGSRLVDLLRVVCRSCYNKRAADCESLAPPFL